MGLLWFLSWWSKHSSSREAKWLKKRLTIIRKINLIESVPNLPITYFEDFLQPVIHHYHLRTNHSGSIQAYFTLLSLCILIPLYQLWISCTISISWYWTRRDKVFRKNKKEPCKATSIHTSTPNIHHVWGPLSLGYSMLIWTQMSSYTIEYYK